MVFPEALSSPEAIDVSFTRIKCIFKFNFGGVLKYSIQLRHSSNHDFLLIKWVHLSSSSTNTCSGQACVTSNKWNWILSDSSSSPLLSADLVAVRDMVSSGEKLLRLVGSFYAT